MIVSLMKDHCFFLFFFSVTIKGIYAYVANGTDYRILLQVHKHEKNNSVMT